MFIFLNIRLMQIAKFQMNLRIVAQSYQMICEENSEDLSYRGSSRSAIATKNALAPAPAAARAAGPRRAPRGGKLWRARSRLYRNEILQVNMRLKALVEICTMHSFAQL